MKKYSQNTYRLCSEKPAVTKTLTMEPTKVTQRKKRLRQRRLRNIGTRRKKFKFCDSAETMHWSVSVRS